MKSFLILFCFLKLSFSYAQIVTPKTMGWQDYRQICEQRIRTAKENRLNEPTCIPDSINWHQIIEVDKKYLFLQDNCVIYAETKVLDPNPRRKIVLYTLFLETGFQLAAVKVDIQHHDKCKFTSHKIPKETDLVLPNGGSILTDIYEKLIKLKAI
jgi:hypothetical protein